MLLDDYPLKISIIGLGHCGTALTQLLLGCRDFTMQLNVVDPSPYTEGAWLDLAHAAAAMGQHSIVRNDPALLARSHIIFYAAGQNSTLGASRNTVLKANVQLTRQIFHSVDLRPDARVIVITNPVDIITFHVWKATGLPAAQVVGTGTLLDSHRLQWILHERKGVPLDQIKAWVLGEHGASMVPVFSQTEIGDKGGNELSSREKTDLTVEVRGAATQIRQTAPATKWGVTACAYEILRAFLDPPRQGMALGVCLDESMQEHLDVGEMYLGMPVRFDEKGCHCDFNLELEKSEWEALRISAKMVQGLLGGT